ncbi:MAG TPA: glycosyltransferase family 2 protein, partial [Flavobacteriales bacterium]
KLSVIIVNYNVRAYLEQCLRSVRAAMEGVDGEVYVIDNVSVDGSVEMVRGKFPEVKLIANTENVGFSRANNQAIRLSTAEHVVLLNPDTVVGEDVFRKVIAFLDAHPKCGGLGVRMIDGTGRFLPESKRGLPTPAVSFSKISGLSRFFPRSKVFGRYHLGHLPEHANASVEILSGACMFLRKEALDKVGLLDEDFFMYGEDIDLSYRIILGGYENWYFAEAPIIHYKGESTKKSSVNYVFVFYNAMAIFARKHFARSSSDLFSFLIRIAIWASAAGAVLKRFFRRALLPVTDLVFLFAGLLTSNAYSEHGGPALAYGLIMLVTFYLMGAYDVPLRLPNVVKGSVLAGLLIACFMWWKNGGPWIDWVQHGSWLLLAMAASGLASRLLLRWARISPFAPADEGTKRILAIGGEEAARKALDLLWQTHFGLAERRHMDASSTAGTQGLAALRKNIERHRIDEVVFCADDLPWARIIELMAALRDTGVEFKITRPGTGAIIGPSSIESLDDLLFLERHAISSVTAKRRKRLLDLGAALLLLTTLPIGIWMVRNKGGFVRNIMRVLLGLNTWVGYAPVPSSFLPRGHKLPPMRPGIVDPVRMRYPQASPLMALRMDLLYAKDYRSCDDLRAMFRSRTLLGG